jgi:hypothetical protein
MHGHRRPTLHASAVWGHRLPRNAAAVGAHCYSRPTGRTRVSPPSRPHAAYTGPPLMRACQSRTVHRYAEFPHVELFFPSVALRDHFLSATWRDKIVRQRVPRERKMSPGAGHTEAFYCPHCGSFYSMTATAVDERQSGAVLCVTCEHTMKSWDVRHVFPFRLLKEREPK